MQHITAEELKQKQESGEKFFLVDVRESWEHAQENIGGSLLPLGSILQKPSFIPREIPVIVYCEKGIRSQLAIQRLEQKFNYSNLINLQGGMQAWRALQTQAGK